MVLTRVNPGKQRGGLEDSGEIAKYVENVGKLRVQRIKSAIAGTQSGRRLELRATQGTLCVRIT